MQLYVIRSLPDLQENYFKSFSISPIAFLVLTLSIFQKVSEGSDNRGFWLFERQIMKILAAVFSYEILYTYSA